MANTTVDSHVRYSELGTASCGIFFFAISFLCLICVGFSNAEAAEWKFVPSISFSETYTDNVRLLADGKDGGSYITQISPGIAFSANGQRLKLQANYAMQNSYYSGARNDTQTSHFLSANANMILVRSLLFLDGTANISQQNLSPFGQVADNNLNLSNNRVEVKTYKASPYLRRNFDNKFTGELRYSYDSVTSGGIRNFNSNATPNSNINSTSDNVLFSLRSGPAFTTVNWGLNYNTQKTHFEKQMPYETEMLTLNLSAGLLPTFRVTSTAGHERNTYVTLGSKPPGNFGTVGFAWSPTQRTNLVFNAGQRFFGKTYALTFNQRARMSVWSLGYNDDVTTTRGQFLVPATNNTSAFLNQLWLTTIPDATARQQTVDNFIRDSNLPAALAQPVNTFTNQVFLQKSLQGSVGLTGVQNSVVLSLFNNLREPLSTGGVDPLLNPSVLRKVKQTGVNTLWNVRLSPRTNANVSASYSKAETIGTNLIDNNKTFRASISKQFPQKLSTSLEVRHMEHDSTIVASNHEENAITLFLSLSF